MPSQLHELEKVTPLGVTFFVASGSSSQQHMHNAFLGESQLAATPVFLASRECNNH